MLYKFEFMLGDYCPEEYKDRQLEHKKREAVEGITNALIKDMPFVKRDSHGRDIWGLEVVAIPAKRFQQFINSLNSGLLDSHTRAFMIALVERMDEPWDEEEENKFG